jgi:CheY-like chemotaxis protein
VTTVILVVDDDDDARATVGDLLRLNGYEVAAAGNGQDALAVCRRLPAPPHLMVIDLRMPVMDGWELLAAKAGVPELRAVPVVIVSGEPDAKMRLPQPSVVGCLGKPLRAPALLQAVRDGLAPSAMLAAGTGSVVAIPTFGDDATGTTTAPPATAPRAPLPTDDDDPGA